MSLREGRGMEMHKGEDIGREERGDRGSVEEFFDCLWEFNNSFTSCTAAPCTHAHLHELRTLQLAHTCTQQQICIHVHIQRPSPHKCTHVAYTQLKPFFALLLHSAQYIQVHRWGLGQVEEQTVDFFNVETHVWLSLPAAQHQVIHFFRTGPRALQHPALGYTLYHLQSERKTSIKLIVRRSPVHLVKNKAEKINSVFKLQLRWWSICSAKWKCHSE